MHQEDDHQVTAHSEPVIGTLHTEGSVALVESKVQDRMDRNNKILEGLIAGNKISALYHGDELDCIIAKNGARRILKNANVHCEGDENVQGTQEYRARVNPQRLENFVGKIHWEKLLAKMEKEQLPAKPQPDQREQELAVQAAQASNTALIRRYMEQHEGDPTIMAAKHADTVEGFFMTDQLGLRLHKVGVEVERAQAYPKGYYYHTSFVTAKEMTDYVGEGNLESLLADMKTVDMPPDPKLKNVLHQGFGVVAPAANQVKTQENVR